MKIEFVATENFSDRQKEALEQLGAAVYPPEIVATLPGRFFTWARPQWSVLLWEDEELLSRVGLLVREVFHNGTPKRLGGIGGVMAHPAKQGQGLTSQALREASRLFNAELNVSYALLFCRPHLVAFYKRLSWKPFQGQVRSW